MGETGGTAGFGAHHSSSDNEVSTYLVKWDGDEDYTTVGADEIEPVTPGITL